MTALTVVQPTNAEVYRASTDAAGLCREIVLQTAQNIQGRRYVRVEGWQAIAIAHGCTASADHVERVEDEGASGYRAIGIVRRMSDGAEIARAEGFLGDDETMWKKRPVYARRAMVQTRAISRACRSAFAHVVVLIDANLSTTPAEEVPAEGFDNGEVIDMPSRPSSAQAKRDGAWDKLQAEMAALTTPADLAAWGKANAQRIRDLPSRWHEPARDAYALRMEELRRAEKPAVTALDVALQTIRDARDEATLDEAFAAVDAEGWPEVDRDRLIDAVETRRLAITGDDFLGDRPMPVAGGDDHLEAAA